MNQGEIGFYYGGSWKCGRHNSTNGHQFFESLTESFPGFSLCQDPVQQTMKTAPVGQNHYIPAPDL